MFSKNIGLVIFFVFIALQVIGSIMQKRAKEKQQRELKDQRQRVAESRTAAQVQTTQAAPTTRSPAQTGARTAPAPVAATGTRETLAARRRAQLEELRLRRQSQPAKSAGPTVGKTAPRPGGSRGGSRGGSAGGPGGLQPTTMASKTPPRAPSTRGQPVIDQSFETRIAQKAAKRQRDQAGADSVQRQQRDQDQQERKRRAARSRRPAVAAPETAADDVWATAPRSTGSEIARQLKDHRTLRRLIILRELLDPPVALRSSQ